MTIETTGADQSQTSGQDTSQDTGQDTSQTLTDQQQEQSQQQADQTNDKAGEAGADAAADGQGADEAGQADGGADPWKDAELDEETRKFVGDKTPAQIAKELLGAQKLLGKKSIGIPGKDATPEEHRAFHKARGVPEEAAGYDFADTLTALKETAPEGWALSEPMETAFRNAARLSNLSNGEANEFAKHFLGEQFKQREQFVSGQMQAVKDGKALMAKEWGADQTVNEANFARGMKAIGLEGEGVDVLLEAVAGSGAARFNAVNAIANIGRGFSEGGPVPGALNGDNNGAMTKQQARAEMERIKADPVLSDAYNDVNNPRHNEVTQTMTRLGKIERGIA